MRNALIIVGAVVLCFGLGFLIPRMMNDGTKGETVDMAVLEERFEKELDLLLQKQMEEQALIDKLEAEYDEMIREQRSLEAAEVDTSEETVEVSDQLDDDETTSEVIHEDSSSEVVEEVTEVISPESTPVANTDKQETSDDQPIASNEGSGNASEAEDISPEEVEVVEPEEEPVEYTEDEQVVKDQWVQQQINDNRDQIEDADLYTGAEIYNVLDTGYLFDLAEGGLTDEEREEVEAYLRATLTPDQLETALTLYNKYVHLIN